MDASAWLSFFAPVGLGIAMMAAPLLFPRMKREIVRMLFYSGCAVFFLCLILLAAPQGDVGTPKAPIITEKVPLSPHEKPEATMVSLNNRNNRYEDVTFIGSSNAIHEEGGENDEYSRVKVIDPTAVTKPGQLICWALRRGKWAHMTVSAHSIPKDVDGCQDPQTGEVRTWPELRDWIQARP